MSEDTISRQAAIDALDEIESEVADGNGYQYEKWRNYFCELPSAQPEKHTEERTETHACDCIERQAAIDALHDEIVRRRINEDSIDDGALDEFDTEAILRRLPPAQPERLTDDDFETIRIHLNAHKEKLCNQHRWEEADEYQRIIDRFMAFASAQPDSKELSPTHKALDTISRKAAIDALRTCYDTETITYTNGNEYIDYDQALKEIEQLPSAQPECTCVNCGRTVNNGGWYADGRTRCPIEEHYALPKDGYCHLWEKRNVTDDDYPERRTDEA